MHRCLLMPLTAWWAPSGHQCQRGAHVHQMLGSWKNSGFVMPAPRGQGWLAQLPAAMHAVGTTACPRPLGMAVLGIPARLHVPVQASRV